MLKVNQRLGKYRIKRRLASGGFSDVYRAFDTVEGISVALKVPHLINAVSTGALEKLQREIRLAAKLDHPNILALKNAERFGEKIVMVYPLGAGTLADRLERRLPLRAKLDFAEQMLEALAFAHERKVIHCDVKPENFIMFPGERLRLTDFGLAKIALRTMSASASGTVGYLAPEQALGKPSTRSDVFSLGLVFYEMFAGVLPEWPFEWPLEGAERLRRTLPTEMISLLRRALEVNQRKRFADAGQMLDAFRRIRPRVLAHGTRRRRRKKPGADWHAIRLREFQRRFGKILKTHDRCSRCVCPVAESMTACPWCGAKRPRHRGETRFPARCPRCRRGMKLDWRFCPWCYGGVIGPRSSKTFTDVRYEARCRNPACSRRLLMPFMRYCPWCRKKIAKRWCPEGMPGRCGRCGWGVAPGFWTCCPWCGGTLRPAQGDVKAHVKRRTR